MTHQIKINTGHIGDDNDYSCFLSGIIYKLWLGGHIEEAFRLLNTDTMVVRQLGIVEFMAEMERQKISRTEQAEAELAMVHAYATIWKD
jgi:hypothetical protein